MQHRNEEQKSDRSFDQEVDPAREPHNDQGNRQALYMNQSEVLDLSIDSDDLAMMTM